MGGTKNKIVSIEKEVGRKILQVKEALNLFDPVIIYPYRGYGNTAKAVVKGRVLEKESVVHDGGKETETVWKNLYKIFKRYQSDEIPKVGIKGTFRGCVSTTTTNDEGYFILEFLLDEKDISNGWHKGTMEIVDMPFDLAYEKSTTFEILIADGKHDFGIISDVDDTIIKTYASDTIDRLSTLLTKDAQSRTPFEGVKNLYDCLVGEEKRPLFFVSGSAYNLYDLLVKFCTHHKICKAPFLLRDLGMSSEKWFKIGTEKYKLNHIEEIFSLYPNLDFILIGDSGQKDPEIYQTVAEKYPNRVRAVYIRHVDGENRKKELEEIKKQLSVDLLIMNDSKEAVNHATARGWAKVR